MSYLVTQLHSHIENFPSQIVRASDGEGKSDKWVFNENLKPQNTPVSNEFYTKIVERRALLEVQYHVQSTVVFRYVKNKENISTEQLIEALEDTLALNMLLEQCYQYLDQQNDVQNLYEDRAILMKLLAGQYPEFSSVPQAESAFSYTFVYMGRAWHGLFNNYRLILIRSWRLVSALMLLEKLAFLLPLFRESQSYIIPFFLYLNWIFFLPRLLANLYWLTESIFLSFTASPDEYLPARIPWFTALTIRLAMHRHGLEIINDLVWFAAGLVICFVCVGSLTPWRIPIAIGLQVYDLLLVIWRTQIEINRLHLLEEEYLLDCENEIITLNSDYLTALHNHLEFGYIQRDISLLCCIFLVASVISTLPVLILIHPALPIIGASLGVIASIIICIQIVTQRSRSPAVSLNDLAKDELLNNPPVIFARSLDGPPYNISSVKGIFYEPHPNSHISSDKHPDLSQNAGDTPPQSKKTN